MGGDVLLDAVALVGDIDEDPVVSFNGYVFVEVPIPEGKKAPYRLRVSGVPTTFEETAHGTISFAIYIK